MKISKSSFLLLSIAFLTLFSISKQLSLAQDDSIRLLLVPADSSENWQQADLTEAAQVIERRLLDMGYENAVVQVLEGSIIVEASGVSDRDFFISTILTPTQLEFVDFLGVSTASIPDYIGEKILTTGNILNLTPEEIENRLTHPTSGQPFTTVLTGANLNSANAELNEQRNQWFVQVEIAPEYSGMFGDFTAGRMGQPLAIVLDGEVLSIPTITGRIDNNLVISANFTEDEATTLALQLRSGRLPLSLQVDGIAESDPVAYSQGWNVYITNVVETASEDRGWKNVTVDVVFESTHPTPFPLYGWKYISLLDSTETWRERIPLGWNPSSMRRDNRIMLPRGVRFMQTSQEIRVPENATIESYRVEVCGSSDCSSQYAVFSIDVFNETPFEEFIFPTDSLVTGIPTMSEGMTIEIPDLANITFRGVPRVENVRNSIYVLFDVEVENLTGNDISSRDIYVWQGTSVTNTGQIYADDNVYCTREDGDSNWTIPPSYTDPLVCRAVVNFNDDTLHETVWFGLSWEETGIYFGQFLSISD